MPVNKANNENYLSHILDLRTVLRYMVSARKYCFNFSYKAHIYVCRLSQAVVEDTAKKSISNEYKPIYEKVVYFLKLFFMEEVCHSLQSKPDLSPPNRSRKYFARTLLL